MPPRRRFVRPEQFERRARLVSAIARGRRWLDDVGAVAGWGLHPLESAAFARRTHWSGPQR
jgi:hypothetical protein